MIASSEANNSRRSAKHHAIIVSQGAFLSIGGNDGKAWTTHKAQTLQASLFQIDAYSTVESLLWHQWFRQRARKPGRTRPSARGTGRLRFEVEVLGIQYVLWVYARCSDPCQILWKNMGKAKGNKNQTWSEICITKKQLHRTTNHPPLLQFSESQT